MITWNGKTQTIAEWAEELGINRKTLTSRLRKWPLNRAMTIGVREGQPIPRPAPEDHPWKRGYPLEIRQ